MAAAKSTKAPLLIGLYSPVPQQGKSTTADILSELIRLRNGAQAGANVFMIGFAGGIRQLACCTLEAIGLTDWQATRAVYEAKDATIGTTYPGTIGPNLKPRDLILDLGKFLEERIGPDVLALAWSLKVRRFLDKGHAVICDDIRQPNQFEAVKALGGKVVRIVRTGLKEDEEATYPENWDRRESLLETNHFDATIYNNGTKDDLEKAALRFLRSIT